MRLIKAIVFVEIWVSHYSPSVSEVEVWNSEVEVFNSEDANNNIKQITDNGKFKTYNYDANNQLTMAVTPGKFVENQPTEVSNH